MCSLCLRHDCIAQPRAFDASNLIIRDDQGNVIKNLMESPCWKDLGYNPDMPKQMILDQYDYCEGEKRKKIMLTWGSIILLVGFLGLMLRSAMKKAKAGP
jgi:hypothetical protein